MVTPVMMSFSSSRHLLMRARLLRSNKGLVIFLYVCVLERGTSESPELPEAPLNFNWEGREMSSMFHVFLPKQIRTKLTCSGEESVDAEESNVVEETLGVKAETENGLCQFITSSFFTCQFITKPSSLSFT